MKKHALNIIGVINTLIYAIKTGKFKDWLYEFKNGHSFLLNEECDIICDTRAEEKYKWMNDSLICKLIDIRTDAMYKKKFPNAKKWSLPIWLNN